MGNRKGTEINLHTALCTHRKPLYSTTEITECPVLLTSAIGKWVIIRNLYVTQCIVFPCEQSTNIYLIRKGFSLSQKYGVPVWHKTSIFTLLCRIIIVFI